MVNYGLRAQLKSGNLVTGQLLVSLDFFPRAPKARINWSTDPPRFPTTPSSLVELEASLGKVMKKLEMMPLDEVVGDVRQALHSFDTAVQSLDTTMKSTDQMVKRLDSQVVTEARATLEDARKTMQAAKRVLEDDAPLQQDLRETLRELSRAAQSLRMLTDQLERHPESLISGKPAVKGE